VEGNWSLTQGVMYKAETGDFFGASDARGIGNSGSPNRLPITR